MKTQLCLDIERIVGTFDEYICDETHVVGLLGGGLVTDELRQLMEYVTPRGMFCRITAPQKHSGLLRISIGTRI